LFYWRKSDENNSGGLDFNTYKKICTIKKRKKIHVKMNALFQVHFYFHVPCLQILENLFVLIALLSSKSDLENGLLRNKNKHLYQS
jgi:hypothetical protein